ncbi:MAG: dienelactone hydrolase family protein [Janthinobacterium lividum]
MNSRWIDIDTKNGNNFKGYLSLPPTGTGPGIVLIQEIWGVNEHIRAVADQYAMDGYVVLAPDVFWRLEPGVNLDYVEEDTKKAYGFRKTVDTDLATQDMAKAAALLRSLPETKGGVASIGYCYGGLLSYLTAASGAVDAAICYYPGGIENYLGKAADVRVPILFHFAGDDDHISMETVDGVKKMFADARNAVVDVYAGVDHGFNCWGRPSYNQKAAAVARGLSLSLLGKVL